MTATITGNGQRLTLPPKPGRFVPTPVVGRVAAVMQACVLTGDVCLIDGPVGVGKTTAVSEAARTLPVEVAYVNMVGTTTALDAMKAIWEAMTGTRSVGTAATIRDDIRDFLLRNRVLLIIDDVHHIRKEGLKIVLGIWNTVHNRRGQGTPIVLCGNDLYAYLSFLKELRSRSGLAYTATPLAGRDLIPTILAMEPNIAGTDPVLIQNLNRHQFDGELRKWGQFFTLLAFIRSDAPPTALTGDEAEQVLTLMSTRSGR